MRDLVDGPEALERHERRERAHELGLVVGVAVVPVGGFHRDALGVLALPAAAGLLVARVGLDRERLRRREHLQQERQLVSEVVADLAAEDADGVVLDGLVEGAEAGGATIREGAFGCAPIHSSASGPADGTGRPRSSAMAVRDPHA